MTTHTPGPWVWDGAQVCTKTEGVIAECGLASTRQPNEFLKYEECAANARLIAAAPDMREVIAEALHNLDMDGPGAAAAVLNTKGRAAIAKACPRKGEKS